MKLPALFRRKPAKVVMHDAEALMRAYGEGAYEEARTRARNARQGTLIDANRPAGHWDKVRLEIARCVGREGSSDTASRYPDA